MRGSVDLNSSSDTLSCVASGGDLTFLDLSFLVCDVGCGLKDGPFLHPSHQSISSTLLAGHVRIPRKSVGGAGTAHSRRAGCIVISNRGTQA